MHAPSDRSDLPAAGPASGLPPARGRRRAQAAAVGLAVLVLHGLALQGLSGPGGADEAVPPLPALVQAPVQVPVLVRSLALATTPPGAVPVASPGPVAATPAPPPVPTPVVPVPAPVPVLPPAVSLAASSPEPSPPPPATPPLPEPSTEPVPPPVPQPPALVQADPAASAPGAPAAPPPDAGAEVLPVYATLLPPPATLDYVLRRGLLSGSGRLTWAPDAEGGYEARLEGGAFGQTLLAQVSRGRVDAHGLAPERFTDRRRGRGEQAANFQREAGLISFSGPPVTHPLHPGAQDRVSWLVQVGAILAADATMQRPGAAVKLFVVGARGDADVWTFVVQGRQVLNLPGRAPAETLHVLRAPHRPFDTRAEAWLDPARGLLPVRVRLTTPDSGDETELTLARD